MLIINAECVQENELRILLDALRRYSKITMGSDKAITEEMITEIEFHQFHTAQAQDWQFPKIVL